MAEFSPTPRVILSTQPDTVNSRKTAGPEVVVRLQSLDGTWETCGVDRAAGIFPENVTLSSDSWGPKTASFDLRRDPMLPWPDVLAFTPVKIEVDGQLVWSGRVSETPSREGAESVMSVTCEGWQAHLDDDLVDRMWVHDDLTAWKDFASLPTTPLGSGADNASTAYRVIAGDGKLTLSVPNGAPMPQYTGVGAVLDLGPGRLAKRIVATWTATWVTANMRLYARGVPDGRFFGATDYADAFVPTLTTGPTTSTGNLGNGYRYVVLVAFYSGAAGTAGQDVNVSLSSIKVFGETAYESGNASVLRASTVVGDVIDRAAPMLVTDRSAIQATSFNIPELAPADPQTPREVISTVNGWHNWQPKIDVNRRPVFRPQPDRPRFTVGDWSAVELQDSSQNSGQDIYNRVVVTGSDPAGQPVKVVRSGAQSQAARPFPQSDIALSNPSFAGNVSGWTMETGLSFAYTSAAGTYDSAPGAASLGIALGAPGQAVATMTGTAYAGRTYQITCRINLSTGSGGFYLEIVGTRQGSAITGFGGGWGTHTFMWTPLATMVDPVLQVNATFNGGGTAYAYFDTFDITRLIASLPDRRNFARTKQLQVGSTLPTDGAAAAAIGDVWLTQHVTTPFRGTLTATGPQAIRDRLTGLPVQPAQLLCETGELIHFSDRIHPDTGAVGRDGRIAAVTYNPLTDTATITLDNNRADFDALMARLAITGGR